VTDFSDSWPPVLATLVEGANDASLKLVDPQGQFTLNYGCAIAGDQATCTGVEGTETFTEVDTKLPIQLAQGTSPTSGPGTTSGGGTTGTSAGGSNSGSLIPSSTGAPSAAMKTARTSNLLLAGVYLLGTIMGLASL
jgi:hypothetical protein